MELKNIKRINNIPRFYNGTIGQTPRQYTLQDVTYGRQFGMLYKNLLDNPILYKPINIGGITNTTNSIGTTNKINTGDIANVVSPLVDFGGNIANSFSLGVTLNQLQLNAGSMNAVGSGFSYNKLNDINQQEELSTLSKQNTVNTLSNVKSGATAGTAVGSIFGPVGGAIGAGIGALGGFISGLFGGKSRKRKLLKRMNAALDNITRNNNYAMSSAHSNYLDQQYGLEHEYTQDDRLYS